MEEKTVKIDDILRRIAYAIRKHWIIIVAFVVVAAAIGFVYSNMQKVTYTASCKMVYQTKDLNAKSSSSSYTNVSLSKNYLPTVTEFCRQGCVFERANYYYYEYKHNGPWTYQEGDVSFTGLPAYMRIVRDRVDESRKEEYRDYTIEQLAQFDPYLACNGVNPYKNTDLKASSFGVSSNEDSLTFSFSYSDLVSTDAIEKIQIAILAVESEALLPGEAISEGAMEERVSQYFYNAKVIFNNIDGYSIPCYNNVNRPRTIMIFAIVGLAVSLFVIYLLTVLNKTMRDKDELERITGVNVLAYIGDQDGGR